MFRERIVLDDVNVRNEFEGGRATIQLLEGDRVVKEIQTHNFVGPAVLDLRRFFQYFIIAGAGRPTIGTSFRIGTDANSYTVHLTDSDAYPNPSTYPTANRFVLGNTIGYSYHNTYSGSDTERGTLNTAETTGIPGGFRLVYDWPTHAANGTIKSIYFTSFGALTSQMALQHGLVPCGQIEESTERVYGGRPDQSRGLFWIYPLFDSTASQYTLAPYSAISSYGNWFGRQPAYGNNTFWILQTATQVQKLASDGTLLDTYTAPRNLRGLFYRDGYLYAIGEDNYLYRYSTSLTDETQIMSLPLLSTTIMAFYVGEENGTFFVLTSQQTESSRHVLVVHSSVTESRTLHTSYTTRDTAYYSDNPTGVALWKGVVLDWGRENNAGDWWQTSPFGNVVSRIVLPEPIIKTSANTLKVVYEWYWW